MIHRNEIEKIKNKVNELDAKLDKLVHKTFAYLTAIISVLDEKGIVSVKDMISHIEAHKKQFSQIAEDAEFWQMMQQFKKRRKGK